MTVTLPKYWSTSDKAPRNKSEVAKSLKLVYDNPRLSGEGIAVLALPQQAEANDQLCTLLLAVGKGDRQAFAAVYQASASRLYPVALKMLRQQEAAEDVLQEAFISIWRKAEQFDPDRGEPLGWMTTIVRNCAIDRLRSQRRTSNTVELSEAPEIAVPEPNVSPQMAISMRACLQQLEENQRKAILFTYYYGMTHEELATRLDAPLGTVKSWVRRGLLQLRGCLES